MKSTKQKTSPQQVTPATKTAGLTLSSLHSSNNVGFARAFANLDKYLDKILMPMRPHYESATLHAPQDGTWRFIFYNMHPATGKLERCRPTFNINRTRDLKQRKAKATEWVTLINSALANGYNYWVEEKGFRFEPLPAAADLPQVKATVAAAPEISITQALAKALPLRVLGKSDRTYTSYKSFNNKLATWLTENDMQAMPVSEFSTNDFIQYLFHKSELGHKNNGINDHISYFKTTFDVIRKKLKLIKVNPLDEVDFLPEHGSNLFQPMTEDELLKIVPALIEHNPRFYLYTKFVAYQYIRPYHIARLQVKDILYESNDILLHSVTTKNKNATRKQLMQPIRDMLIAMGYHTLPGNYYLFGSGFMPSATLSGSQSNRASELWKEIVIDGLKIDKKMYALKHTSSQYFVNENENADIKWVQQHMEHSTMAQTEIYLQDKIKKRVDESRVKMLLY